LRPVAAPTARACPGWPIARAIAPWGELIGDQRFETEGEWREKLAGGTRGTVDVLARELRAALRP